MGGLEILESLDEPSWTNREGKLRSHNGAIGLEPRRKRCRVITSKERTQTGKSEKCLELVRMMSRQKCTADSKDSAEKSDDTCGFCGDGGELLLCDHCPSAYHLSCMGLKGIPEGDWYCSNCRCGSCEDGQFNADRSTFNDLSVVFCEQCELGYHAKCLRSRGRVLDSIPQDVFFCGADCERIFRGLRSLVGVCKRMEDGFSRTLLRSLVGDKMKAGCVSNEHFFAEYDSKLFSALGVMNDCFDPIKDPETGVDLIAQVLYNRSSDVRRLNHRGFYSLLLERGNELISVATIRVHGSSLAEMPLIGTLSHYRSKGMCRRLMGALVDILRTLGVERLVLPAVPNMLDYWINKFGFQRMGEFERCRLTGKNIVAFPGTSILYKDLDLSGPPVKEADHAEIVNVRPELSKDHVDCSRALHPVTPNSNVEITTVNSDLLCAAEMDIANLQRDFPKRRLELSSVLTPTFLRRRARLLSQGTVDVVTTNNGAVQSVIRKRKRGRPRKSEVPEASPDVFKRETDWCPVAENPVTKRVLSVFVDWLVEGLEPDRAVYLKSHVRTEYAGTLNHVFALEVDVVNDTPATLDHVRCDDD